MAITKCPNLMLLPFTPVGKHVEGHLDYLGKVIKSWRRYAWQCERWTETQVEEAFDPRCDAVVKANIPMYSTPYGRLTLPEPPPPEEPPLDEGDPEAKDPARRFRRQFERKMKTLGKKMQQRSIEDLLDDNELATSLEDIVSAQKSYMHHRDRRGS